MDNIREKFPILLTEVNGHKLVYLDTASTSQKPIEVIECITNFYLKHNSNTGRAPYKLSMDAGEFIDNTRTKIKNLINAKYNEEIVFTRGTTDSINIIASCYGLNNINKGDEIVIAISEHHANIIPWQQVAIAKGAVLKYIYFEDNYILSKNDIQNVITNKTKLVCIAHVSNSFGTINPIEFIIKKAKFAGARVVVDAAQSIAHIPVDVSKLDIDFLAFSGHKMYGPMGVGVLYGKKELLDSMPPHVFGGGMVSYANENEATFLSSPEKFEGGTKNVEAILGIGAAVDFINSIGYEKISQHDKQLYKYAYDSLKKLDYIKLFVNDDISNHCGVLSFEVIGVHSHDVATILDSKGICIRPGKHCAQPLLKYIDTNSTCRISFGVYNNNSDIDKLINGLQLVKEMFL